jgi:hypothetical protein
MQTTIHHEKRVRDWFSLRLGDFVVLEDRGGQRHACTIDDRTEDGVHVWIRNTLNERKLLHIDDGYGPAGLSWPAQF